MVPDVVSLEAATVEAGPTSAIILVIISITRIDELVLFIAGHDEGASADYNKSAFRFNRVLKNP